MTEDVLWDLDYDDEMIDTEPRTARKVKNIMGISNDYYTSLPDDPPRKKAKRLLKDVDNLCERVIGKEVAKLDAKVSR